MSMNVIQEFVLANQFTEFAMADNEITPTKDLELTEQRALIESRPSAKEEKVN